MFVAALVLYIVASLCVTAGSRAHRYGKILATYALAAWIATFVWIEGLGDLTAIVMNGVLAAWFVLSCSWLGLMLLEATWTHALHPVLATVSGAFRRLRKSRTARLERLREEHERKATRQREFADAPRRERERIEAEVRERCRMDEQLRRENARFECQVLFDQYRVELAGRLPDTQLLAYFTSYMADDRPVEEVERRATLLKTLIRESVEEPRTKLADKFQSIADIAACFGEKKDRIRDTNYDDDTKDTLIRAINREETAVLTEFLKR